MALARNNGPIPCQFVKILRIVRIRHTARTSLKSAGRLHPQVPQGMGSDERGWQLGGQTSLLNRIIFPI